MKTSALIFFSIFVALRLGAQTPADCTIKRPTVAAIGQIETMHGGMAMQYPAGISFSLSKGYFPNSDQYTMGQPIYSERKTSPTPTTVNYYFSIPDSTVRLIEYTWNQYRDKATLLEKIFADNSAYFSSLFKNEGETKSEDHGNWIQKTIHWEDKTTYVEQFMVIGSGTYRVRVLVSWK